MGRAQTLAVLAVVPLATVLLVSPPVRAGARRLTEVTTFDVPPLHNREVCTLVMLHRRKALDVGEIHIKNTGTGPLFTTHHAVIYQYTGPLASVSQYAGQVVDDTACLNFGPRGSAELRVVATSQSITSRQPSPRRTALRLEPQPTGVGSESAIGLLLNSHWVNASTEVRRARLKVTLVPARKPVKRLLKPIFEVVANAVVEVPPGVVASVGWEWGPGLPDVPSLFLPSPGNPQGPACVSALLGHMHRRGTLFTADLVDRDGSTTPLYTNTQYDNPPLKTFEPPLLVVAGQKITYTCTHDNAADPRLGCEENPGVPPGKAVIRTLGLSGAAKGCTAERPNSAECPAQDPAYPGRTFTGNCVRANLVFGFGSGDEMCILPGFYYDADPSAPPGRECTL